MKESASTVEAEVIEKTPQKNNHTKTVKFKQQAFDLDVKEEIKLSPESMNEMINHLNMSIRQDG